MTSAEPHNAQFGTATLPQLYRQAAAAFGDLPLLIEEEGGLSFAQADRQSRRLALALLARGYGKGSRIGILLPNGSAWLTTFMAITRVGGVAVLIPTVYRERELGWLLREGDVEAVVFAPNYLTNDYVRRLEAIAPGLSEANASGRLTIEALPYLRELIVLSAGGPSWAVPWAALDAERLDAAFLDAVEAAVAPADACLVMYTSGSSAEPKAVVHNHGPLVRRSSFTSVVKGFRRGERVLSTGPFFWAGRFLACIHALRSGAALILTKSASLDALADAVEHWRPDHILAQDGAKTELRTLLQARGADASVLALFDFKDGEGRPVPPDRHAHGLGMTETLGTHSFEPWGLQPADRPGSFGRSAPDFERRICGDNGEWLGPGEAGELCLRGPNLFAGLHRRERQDVFEPDGFYRTGDICVIDQEGYLYFVGRSGEMIKTGGSNVSPREVELVMLGHEGVQEALVVGLAKGDRDEEVVAAVVPKPGAHLEPDELRNRVRGDLAAFKAPRRVWVLTPDEVPRGQTGKPDKRALRKLLADRS